MVFAEDIRKSILKLADQRGSANPFSPAEVAQLLDPENWNQQVDQVRLVAEVLIQEGYIISSGKGESKEAAYTKANIRE